MEGPGREHLWVLLMDSTGAEKVILEHILEGSPRFLGLARSLHLPPEVPFCLARLISSSCSNQLQSRVSMVQVFSVATEGSGLTQYSRDGLRTDSHLTA